MPVELSFIEKISVNKDESKSLGFRADLERLPKEELINRLMEVCQCSGLTGLWILLSLVNNKTNNINSKEKSK